LTYYRSQEEGQGHATSHDDGRHDGRRCNGTDGVKNHRFNRSQGTVAEQNRIGAVRYYGAQETVPAATGRWSRNRVTVPSLRPEHATRRRGSPLGVF